MYQTNPEIKRFLKKKVTSLHINQVTLKKFISGVCLIYWSMEENTEEHIKGFTIF